MGAHPPILRPMGRLPRIGGRVYFYTTTIDEKGMAEAISEVEANINDGFRKRSPFAVMRTEDLIDPMLPQVAVSNFHLVVTGDVSIKNDKQATEFCAAMFAALDEVQRMNECNYIVVKPPRRPPM